MTENMDTSKPTEEFLRSIDIHEILPQRDPFVMIDTMVHFEMSNTTTETTIRESNIFVTDGVFTASGLIENIAQTCAARVGYVNKYILLKGVEIGFIGAVRNFVVHRLPAVGQLITTKVDILQDIFGMTLANATVTCEGELVAETEIKLSVRQVE